MQDGFDIAADLVTPVSAYLRLAPLWPRFLLESVENTTLGRYSFIGFGETDVRRLEAEEAGDPLPALRRILESAPDLTAPDEGVPFRGGLVGAFDFEFVRRVIGLPPGRHANGRPPARFLCCASVLAFDHVTQRAALLHAGDEAERQRLRAEVQTLLDGALPRSPGRRGSEEATASMTRGEFCAGVERTQDYIREGEVYQLVLSIRFEGETEVDPFRVYRALRMINPSPYLYYLDFGERSLIGSSPEALVRLEGRRASLRPIAGTRPRGENVRQDQQLQEELCRDEKEAAEHVMLVDLARNDLGRVAATGSVTVEPYRDVERYSHVMHLVSGVEGVLAPEKDGVDLFGAVFPAGTVVGAPKRRAVELIDELEPVPRGFYAGSAGYLGRNGGLDQAIAIRSIEIGEGRYAYQAGAGIVADSVPDREHAEILSKSGAVAQALRRAEDER